MSKKYSTNTTLVIVESPAKCKKIEEYLGPGYKCMATYGHLRELPSLKNIDLNNNFNPTYTIIENAIKKKQIEFLRNEIKNADDVILATDGDREGEKISYCVAQIFKLDIHKTKRITFNEITETAIQNAIKNPRIINIDIVYAQQARQILDILVGFKVSPMLWKFITSPKGKENALSAGRCQTPALKLIYDNDEDIKKTEERKVYNTTGYFTNLNIPFELSPQGKYETEDEITDFLYGSVDFSHNYSCSQPVKLLKKSPEPFTTSRIQQVASNDLHYAPKETMRICQLLYEGGYITYMRTDSNTYSGEFINSVKNYIHLTYADGNKYVSENIDSMISGFVKEPEKKQKSKKTDKPPPQVKDSLRQVKDSLRQEAHEAIRPTNISLCELPSTMDSKEIRMYKLIWENTLESCMTSASFHSVTASITAFDNSIFKYTSELIHFPGWKIVSKKYSNENKEYQYLQTIKQNSIIPYKKICSKVTIKGLKQHYTEARLVQLLEENGIGRPSTFSSLVDKIQERNYVKKEDIKGKEILCKDYELENDEIFEIETKREFGNEKGKLVLQPLGRVVMEFLVKHFNDIFNYEYTSIMENDLDKIAKGELIWSELCDKCNKQLDNLVDGLKDETKIEIKLDENHTYMIGRYGPVIKCIEELDGKEEITFKPIKKDIDVTILEKGTYTTKDIIDTNKTTKTQYILGQYDGQDVILRKGKKGDYIFYKTSKMKKPEFKDIKCFFNETKEDYKICDITILKSWLLEKYKI